ncbi:Glycoside hydrolase/deacetylase, beta/alpha-barrel [Acididesulfobacillus acetoxydans]|uniref:Glycoside hydrolase/deacetylase, beta/alpha-barrel n=1 Tax=Acididesulfobacillus acetoxydans TaxID=1561005 RepID=A0A8S0XUI2_9FIRM|nr:polysaccharide deacetylase family protein [Acididesulfobacillus acetoxydans]CAA7599457.1 Glycoside hydrolase/deacetylase, beta/alpha-barrel [Acididesulfobacillus acetoxydans]CEJ06738.1 Polysaccharide deacetylase protein [Acididesulfobacillus acetoxydans]
MIMNLTGWLGTVLGFVAVILLLYTLLPDFFLHRLGLGCRKRQYTPGVTLTFDDGPDPVVTPRLLDVLARSQVRAVFFVVAERAQRYPELVRRMVAEGHALGIHSLSHRYAWFTGPRRTWREWEEADRVLTELSGRAVEWVRPPWGTFNLLTWWWMNRRGKRAVLWNVEGHDWQKERSVQSIVERILRRVNEGSIIVLHDGSASPGERVRVVPVVEELCRRIGRDLMLPVLPLEFPDWSFGRRTGFILWEKWEHFFAARYRVERIDAMNIFRLAKTTYHGPELRAQSGELLARAGDTVGEIHLDNIRLQAKGADAQKIATKALRIAKESFPVLARYVAESPEYADIKIFLGLSMMYRAVRVFGFEVQDVEATLGMRWIAFLQKVIMSVYHPAGQARLNQRLGKEPKLVWIEKKKLIELWAGPEKRASAGRSLKREGQAKEDGSVC